jgi:AcrR family transcriptional regulator
MAGRAAALVVRRSGGSDATRATILRVVEALLAEGGEGAVSIREVCARAGVTAPTVYHHFGDKDALIERVVDACFAEFDEALARGRTPTDPVEAMRWGFDRYLAYGVAHPAHYRLLFPRKREHPTPSALASFDRLRRGVQAIDHAGRLAVSVDDAAAAFWSAVHGATSLVIAGFWAADAPAVGLVRDAVIAQLTRQTRPRTPRRSARRSRHVDA